jgi:fatty-acyl-CoA synthase
VSATSPGAKPATIPEALFATAERDLGELVFHLDEGPLRLGFPELAERALAGARRLTALGVGPGEAVGLLGPNRPEWAVWAFAVWIAGATLVPVHIPLRIRDPEAFGTQLRGLVEAAGCRLVLADPILASLLPAGVAVSWDEAGEQSGEHPAGPTCGDPAVIQFTSGSTAAPKGALLSHRAVMAQMELLGRGYRRSDDDPRTVLSWTPFFHDLGLFGGVVHPAYAGSTTHHLPTERFARDPAEWLRLIEATRVDGTVGPSSAFGSAVRAAGMRDERIDLSSLEVAYFAAEGVDPEVAQGIVERARELNFDPAALGSTYGLAEAVLGVTCQHAGTGLRIDRISLEQLTASGVAVPSTEAPARLMISCGPPVMDLRIVGPEGELPERHVGEIKVRGPSLMSGYVRGDGSLEKAAFADGWLRTGDLGYLAEGELYVTGRAKDLIIAMGHNYYPEDFEWAAARVAAVRPGRCVAFSDPGTESVVVLVEPKPGQDPSGVERDVRRGVANAVGIAPGDVVALPPGAVEKTTSGKLRRAAMRHAYATGALARR